MSKKQKYTIQIEVSVVVSKEVAAESMVEALETAKGHANRNVFVRPRAGWAIEYENESKVIGVLA